MNLDKIFDAVYYEYVDDLNVDREALYHSVFKCLLDCTANWGNFSSVLFWNEGLGNICYRSSFSDEGHYIKDNYGFQKSKNTLIPITENPNIIKEKIVRFVKEMQNDTYIPKEKQFATSIEAEYIGKPINNLKELNNKTGKTKMKNVFEKMLETNKNTAMYTAKVQLGKTANKVVLDKIKPQLPGYVRGYADSPLAELAVGNVVAGLLMQFAPNNEKAAILANAMIAAGTQVAVESLNIPELVAELLDSVDISEVTEEKEQR